VGARLNVNPSHCPTQRGLSLPLVVLSLTLRDVDDDEDLKDKSDPISDCTCPLMYCRPCCLVEPISASGNESC
jgi:hypothetical protein